MVSSLRFGILVSSLKFRALVSSLKLRALVSSPKLRALGSSPNLGALVSSLKLRALVSSLKLRALVSSLKLWALVSSLPGYSSSIAWVQGSHIPLQLLDRKLYTGKIVVPHLHRDDPALVKKIVVPRISTAMTRQWRKKRESLSPPRCHSPALEKKSWFRL